VINLSLSEKIKEYIRVLKVAKKPEQGEMKSTLRICIIGIGLIGLLGFIFYLASYFLEGGTL
jgi:protein translocase SEC61 complex gamma subunit